MTIVLAAGKGTRMNSDLPKVLAQAAGRPIIDYVLDSLTRAGMENVVVVVGHRSDLVRQALASRPGLRFVEQRDLWGTGHAVLACRELLAGHDGPVFVVAGDSPMLQPDSLRALREAYLRERPACVLGTLVHPHPRGLGRIMRDAAGNFQCIVEDRDATDAQRLIREVNMSTYLFEGRCLLEGLADLTNNNQQREYYITDLPEILLARGYRVLALPVLQPIEAFSVNTPAELQAIETLLRERRDVGC